MEGFPSKFIDKRSQWIRVDAIRIRYIRKGRPGAQALVLLHDIGASLDMWTPNIDYFAKDFDVIALDFPGFGFSDKPAVRYSIHFQVLKLKRFLDQLSLDNIFLVGHSMGGAIAIHFAHLFASRVKKIVLVCSAGLGKKINASYRLLAMPMSGMYSGLLSFTNPEIILKKCLFNQSFIPSDWYALYDHIFSQPGSIYAFLSQLKSFVTVFGQERSFLISTQEKLSQLIMPTLIVWGKNDTIIPVSHAEFAQNNIHQCECLFLDCCGHIPQLEASTMFNARLEATVWG